MVAAHIPLVAVRPSVSCSKTALNSFTVEIKAPYVLSIALFTVVSYSHEVQLLLAPGGRGNIFVYILECLQRIYVLNFEN